MRRRDVTALKAVLMKAPIHPTKELRWTGAGIVEAAQVHTQTHNKMADGTLIFANGDASRSTAHEPGMLKAVHLFRAFAWAWACSIASPRNHVLYATYPPAAGTPGGICCGSGGPPRPARPGEP